MAAVVPDMSDLPDLPDLFEEAFAAAGLPAVSGPELVTNGDFASGKTGWTIS